jgi:hypothetical protein
MRRKKIPLEERKLGREGAYGLCYHGDKIVVDPTFNSRQRLNTLIHEALHFLCPEFDEKMVLSLANAIEKVLWDDRYRRIEE